MDVVFGLFADQGAVPDHGGGESGALGAPVVGPAGLVGLLEVALGLGGPPSPQVVRVAQFEKILEEEAGDRFWSRSLVSDPWATARTLLRWRDELIGLGWDSAAAWAAPRLRDLAAVSQLCGGLSPGLADRIAAIVAALPALAAVPFARLRLIDRQDVLPPPLRRLIACLAARGTVIVEIEPVPAAAADSALGQLQRWMTGEPLAGTPDGSVTVARAHSAPLAAELVGQWFGRAPPGRIALIAQGGGTELLDLGLLRAGQPRAGRSRPSPHRGSLQLLLLAFKTSWRPFDASALMELLVLPGAPVAGRAARRLAAALEEAPGRGSGAWAAAWEAIADTERAYAGDDSVALAAVAGRLERWRAWAEPEISDPIAGMPVAQALAICERVAAWAVRRHTIASDTLYLATAALADDVREALAALGRPLLPRTLIERIIDQALDIGQPNPLAVAEASPWRSTAHPGAVWQPTASVIWWGFEQSGEGRVHAPWSVAERDELAAAGCPADDLALEGRAVSAAWERAVLNAADRLLLISGGLTCDADDMAHPLMHRLASAIAELANQPRLEQALAAPAWSLAGATLTRVPVVRADLPAPRTHWAVPEGFAARRDAATESATSLEALFSCQLMWALRHVARLRPGRVRSIPDASQLLGNLAHAIACDVFPPGPPPTPEDAEARAHALLDERIDAIAAPLRQPELAEELHFARRRLPAAMASLARTLRDNQLVVEATELQVSGTFESLLALRGAVDLVARDPQGRAVIVDLKWTRSANRRLTELREGNAVQLATYGALVAGDAPYRAGYYLLNQRQFATLEGSGLIGRSVGATRGFPDTWSAITSAWQVWRTAADNGSLLATGVSGVEDLLPVDLAIDREVNCAWCDYQTLCRVRGLS